jgi:hypothetical protein
MGDNDYSTYEGCLAAVQKNGATIQSVPEHLKTYEICLAAVHQAGWVILDVPHHMKTFELCLAAVQQDGWWIQLVPDHMNTHELRFAAVQRNGYALRHIPKHQQTDEIIQAALLQNPDAVKFIKKTITITILHGTPKQMPPKAYDTLEMGYDEESAIQDGELMVDFHDEFDYGRFYRKATFEKFILPRKKNGYTGVAITEYTIYQAKV